MRVYIDIQVYRNITHPGKLKKLSPKPADIYIDLCKTLEKNFGTELFTPIESIPIYLERIQCLEPCIFYSTLEKSVLETDFDSSAVVFGSNHCTIL